MGRWLIGLAWVVGLSGCGRLGFGTSDPDARGDGTVTTDGTGDGTGPAGCPPFATLCDDFEAGDLTRWSGDNIVGPSTLAVNGNRVRTGAFALEARSSPSSITSAASTRLGFTPRSTGTLAVRQWINLVTPLINFDLVLDLTGEENEFTTVGGDVEGEWTSTESRASGGPVIDHFTGIPGPPVNTWICVEVVFTFLPPSGGTMQVFVDDVSVLDVAAISPTPTYDELGIGAVRADEIGFHLFVDDVVIADQRIGCD